VCTENLSSGVAVMESGECLHYQSRMVKILIRAVSGRLAVIWNRSRQGRPLPAFWRLGSRVAGA
jgi:hypothetical protein